MTTEAQSARILAALQRGQTLTPMDALKRFKCFRLGARIWDLKQQGYPIRTTMIQHDGKRFAGYWMGKRQTTR